MSKSDGHSEFDKRGVAEGQAGAHTISPAALYCDQEGSDPGKARGYEKTSQEAHVCNGHTARKRGTLPTKGGTKPGAPHKKVVEEEQEFQMRAQMPKQERKAAHEVRRNCKTRPVVSRVCDERVPDEERERGRKPNATSEKSLSFVSPSIKIIFSKKFICKIF